MKKLIAAILTAFLLSAGLVATSSPSVAAPPCPYGGCFPTSTDAIGLKAKAPHKAKIFVKVSGFGNGKPKGRLVFTFVGKRGNSFEFVRFYPKRGAGREGVYNFKPLRKGKYDVIVSFVPRQGSSFQGSSDSTKVKVKGNRRR